MHVTKIHKERKIVNLPRICKENCLFSPNLEDQLVAKKHPPKKDPSVVPG